MRPIVRCMSGIITMDLLVGLKKILETINKEMVMVGIHESSNHERVDGKQRFAYRRNLVHNFCLVPFANHSLTKL